MLSIRTEQERKFVQALLKQSQEATGGTPSTTPLFHLASIHGSLVMLKATILLARGKKHLFNHSFDPVPGYDIDPRVETICDCKMTAISHLETKSL